MRVGCPYHERHPNIVVVDGLWASAWLAIVGSQWVLRSSSVAANKNLDADTDKWRTELLLNNRSGFAMLMFTFEDAIRHILGGDSYRDEAFCFGLPHS